MSLVFLPLLAQLAAGSAASQPQAVPPVLDFPEPGMDDPAAYEGYRTRFYRDAADNTVQLYLKGTEGRVVALLADAANESVGFTVRDSAGRPTAPAWGAVEAIRSATGDARSLEFRLRSDLRRIDLGWFLLGSMRVERDLQYQQRHLRPFDAPPFPRPELDTLIANVERLTDDERQRHLELLGASDARELRSRMAPTVTRSEVDTSWIVTVEQPSFDGRSHLALEFRVNRLATHVQVGARSVVIRSRSGAPIDLAVRITTSAGALTPIGRDDLLNAEFRQFLETQRAATDSAGALRYRWLERQVRGLELVSSREKLMAGLPNFATYFGRDMLMSALMMEPIWSPGMLEHVIGSVLRKLAPTGEVSHEEALGGQAIRENAVVYNERMAEYARARRAGRTAAADSALARARDVLARLDAVRENYNMLDDDFQFPIVVARYLADDRISAERKRAFLRERAGADTTTRLTALLRNIEYVRRSAAPYAARPIATNLVAFPRRPDGTHFPGSWRDSNAGYANGRFAMDINAIWVPEALTACMRILDGLSTLGNVGTSLPAGQELTAAATAWRNAAQHFVVRIPPPAVRAAVRARLAALPREERAYWQRVMSSGAPDTLALEFLALSLDAAGRPIRVASTDPAMALFLQDLPPDRVRRDLDILIRPYPIGLLVPRVGPVVANDAYAPARVWEAFRKDQYHSPRVVWGREVNLLFLALARQIDDAYDDAGQLRATVSPSHVAALDAALRQTLEAVEASGLSHNELWSYRIVNGALTPVRYGSSSDIQLWNLTNLAVQFRLSQLPRP
ncbi:MAG TPA: hypothetical protein VJ802_08285 [Gemmatimonadaceae bacterium]|nr:hypothetical protein [Gemmatimonadaceae bacterium]